MPENTNRGDGEPLDLGHFNLSVSRFLPDKIFEQITSNEPINVDPTREDEINKALKKYGHRVVITNTDDEIAYALRAMQPTLTYGSQSKDKDGILSDILSQAGRPTKPEFLKVSIFKEAITGRKNVALVICDGEVEIPNGLMNLPEDGVLILKRDKKETKQKKKFWFFNY